MEKKVIEFGLSLPSEKCRSCKFMQQLSFTHHIECTKKNIIVSGSTHGINNGWFLFPFNFDPIWLEGCSGFRPKTEKLEDLDSKYLSGLILYNLNILNHLCENNPRQGLLVKKIFLGKDILNRVSSLFSSMGPENDFSKVDREQLIILTEEILKI
jgi:hypothetical protein